MDGIGGGREVQEEGLIHIQKTDSLHCTTETNTHCKVTISQLKKTRSTKGYRCCGEDCHVYDKPRFNNLSKYFNLPKSLIPCFWEE